MPITSVRIHPAIGIARIGNSPEFFIGPEEPGVFTPPGDGKYKDALCRVKKQAARFRLFAFDGNTFVKELKEGDPEVLNIEWTVHLANRKAASRLFAEMHQPAATDPSDTYPDPAKENWRNPDEADREKLVIDAGKKTLDGPNQAAAFNAGEIKGIPVPLGEMRTEADGRLLVLGGSGKAASFNGSGLEVFADNHGWYDDVSDGPVTAKVTLTGNATPPVAPAWVIVGPPKFAPAIQPVITLYDTLLQAWKNANLGFDPGYSIDADLKPFYARLQAHQYVNQQTKVSHSFNAGAPPAAGSNAAKNFAGWLNDPGNPVTDTLMPRIWSSSFEKNGAVEPLQYQMFQRWAGLANPPLPQSSPALAIYDKLDRAALEACIGGNLYPGIEASWWMLEKFQYTAPFRLNHTGMVPGIITSQMAVPWQSDFSACFEDAAFAWWPAARPDQVTRNGADNAVWHLDFGHSREQMVATWDHLGFVLPEGNVQVEKERFAVCLDTFIVTDRNEFAFDEVEGVLADVSPAVFNPAFYVMVEGFTPAELGFTSPNPPNLGAIAPKVTFFKPNNAAAAQMTGKVEAPPMLQSNDLDLRQRVTFTYRVEFTGTDDFLDGANQPIDLQEFTLEATIQGLTATAPVRLINKPNPYMVDGVTTWLSDDLRVFQVTDGGKTPWNTDFIGSNAAAANQFIQQTIDDFNGTPAGPGHPFLTLKKGQEASKLEISKSVGNKRVFNFAIARVHYKAKSFDAEDVRVFFRMFTTAATGMEYRPGETYRRHESGGKAISLLGLQAGDVVSLPFFAAKRETAISMTMQPDPKNVQTLKAIGPNEAYFGCWLDFNQDDPVYPRHPAAPDPVDGPYTVNRISLQEHILGKHQCLVAEVFYAPDEIPSLATPGSSDQLAQRNLMIVESDNPGAVDSHTVAHTFQIGARRSVRLPLPGRATARAAIVIPREDGVDELMIRWGNLPRESDVQVYMPTVDAGALLHQAGLALDVPRLERVDDHTIRLLPADVSFLPIPPEAQKQPIAGLLQIVVPENVRVRQQFQVFIHQISRAERRIIGSFQLTIPVDLGPNLLGDEIRLLSVMKHIARSVPRESPWDSVMARYLDVLAGRVRGFGGEPDRVEPSPDGGEGPRRRNDLEA